MLEAKDELIEVGVVAGTHGLKGDLKVRTLPTGELVLPGARRIFLKDGSGALTLFLADRTTPHKQYILLRLKECRDLDCAQALVGRSVWMPAAEVGELPEDQYLWHELKGLEVVDSRLGSIGRVTGMFTTAAHDVLEIAGAGGEILAPAIPPFITGIDADRGRLLVDLPDGLVPFDGDDAPDDDPTDAI